MDQILARTLDTGPQFKPGPVDGSIDSAVLVESGPVVLFRGRFVSALSGYRGDLGYRRNDSQLGTSFSNTALAGYPRGYTGELRHLYRSCLYRPTIGDDQIMSYGGELCTGIVAASAVRRLATTKS
jgi:hypothetical protein